MVKDSWQLIPFENLFPTSVKLHPGLLLITYLSWSYYTLQWFVSCPIDKGSECNRRFVRWLYNTLQNGYVKKHWLGSDSSALLPMRSILHKMNFLFYIKALLLLTFQQMSAFGLRTDSFGSGSFVWISNA